VVSHDNAAPSPGNLDRPWMELNRELRRFPTKPSKVGILDAPYLGHLGYPHGLPPGLAKRLQDSTVLTRAALGGGSQL